LAAAVEALDCTVLDHLVFAGRECTSFRRLGYHKVESCPAQDAGRPA
jgi:hypothetical protein